MSPSALARLDARRLAVVLQELGGPGAPLGTGWMASDGDGSWADFAAGVLDPVPDDVVEQLVGFYSRHGATPRIQVTPYHPDALFRALSAAGFVVYERETVLRHDLGHRTPFTLPVGVTLVPVTDEETRAAWVQSQATGFFEGAPVPAAMTAITERVARASRCTLWLAVQDGQVVGSAGLECFEGVGVCIAGTVHPGSRRQGIQTALLHHRLAHARDQGLHTVLIAGTPAGPTERNALRAGFAPAYAQLGLELSGRPARG